MEVRIVVAGAFGQRRKKCRFRDVELVERFAEIVQRRRGHAVGIFAEEDFVQIELEDLVLRVSGIDADREHRFLDLARQLDVAVQEEVARHLLRDGRCAFRPLVLQDVEHVLDRRAHDAARIDARMAVEVLVFGRREGVDDEPRHKRDRHEDAPLARILAEHQAVTRIDARGDGRLIVLERFHARQIAGERIDVPGHYQKGRDSQSADGQSAKEKNSPPHTLGALLPMP